MICVFKEVLRNMLKPCRFLFRQLPVLYVVPIQSILGKLPLVPVGDTGTIPFEASARNKAQRDALSEEHYPGAFCDSAPGKGDGCRLWHVNAFAMAWSRDD